MKYSVKPSLSRDYFTFSVMVVFAVIVGGLWFSVSLYQSQMKNRNYRFGIEADRVAEKLTESFNYIANLAEFIGNQIVENNPSDLERIARLLQGKFSPNVREQDFFLWSIFGWIDLNDNVVVSNREGVLVKPNHVSGRKYLRMAPISPWKLHVDNPSVGITSREYVIPSGMGITDKEGRYIGTVTMGFSVSRLTKLMEQAVGTEGISFVLLTRDGQLISQSSDSRIELQKTFFKNKLSYLTSTSLEEDAGLLKTPVTYGNVTYRYYRNIYPYPYILLIGENHYSLSKEWWERVLPFIIPMVGMGIFFIVLLYFFRKTVVNPMVKLSNAAMEIAKHNLAVDIPEGNSFESHTLAKAIESIKASFFHERRLKDALKEAIIEANTAREGAIQASKEKTIFLTNMSHELRTPLNAIIGFSDMLIWGLHGQLSPKNREYVRDIHASGKHLLELINDLLDINKAESGKFELYEEKLDVNELIDYAIKSVEIRADEKHIILQVNKLELTPFLYGDPLRIKQVLVNLLTNAVKYTPSDGSVTVEVLFEENELRIIVQDTGIGIADIDQALSEFGTIDNAYNRQGESTGLGLPLAKKLAELHQARFHIDSQLGQGTKITISFPQSRVILPEPVAA